MSTDRELLKEIQLDLQQVPRTECVIYLEDDNDVDIFFALLGIHRPANPLGLGGVHRGVLIRGASNTRGGGGSKAVLRRISVTENRKGAERILGITDGDGEPLVSLAAAFDPPYAGRALRWKVYCIENLLAKAGWPPAWGTPPDWTEALLAYTPYTALNQLHLEMLELLRRLGLSAFTTPVLGEPLKRAEQVVETLEDQQEHIARVDIAQSFYAHLTRIEAGIRTSLDEGHTLINGKWLLEDYAPRQTKLSREECRTQWLEHVRTSGGLPEVRALWKRLTGTEP